jgi:hypothetical protein
MNIFRSNTILVVGLIAITAGLITTGVVTQIVQALPDSVQLRNKPLQTTAQSLRQSSQQASSNPNLSDLAKNIISSKLSTKASQLDGNGGSGGSGGCSASDPACNPPGGGGCDAGAPGCVPGGDPGCDLNGGNCGGSGGNGGGIFPGGNGSGLA